MTVQIISSCPKLSRIVLVTVITSRLLKSTPLFNLSTSSFNKLSENFRFDAHLHCCVSRPACIFNVFSFCSFLAFALNFKIVQLTGLSSRASYIRSRVIGTFLGLPPIIFNPSADVSFAFNIPSPIAAFCSDTIFRDSDKPLSTFAKRINRMTRTLKNNFHNACKVWLLIFP